MRNASGSGGTGGPGRTGTAGAPGRAPRVDAPKNPPAPALQLLPPDPAGDGERLFLRTWGTDTVPGSGSLRASGTAGAAGDSGAFTGIGVGGVRRVRRTLLRDQAYESIRDAIVGGDLPPGSVVRDTELAELLGLSRAPVREAFSRLTDEGLLESKPQSYTRVTELVAADVRDAAAVVRAMHEVAVRAAVPRLTDTDLHAMREADARFLRFVSEGDIDAALHADDELHHTLVRVADNRAAAATIRRYTPLIRRLERDRFGDPVTCRSAGLHDRLIAACAARDLTAACTVTSEIWRGLEQLADGDDADGPGPVDALTGPGPSRRTVR